MTIIAIIWFGVIGLFIGSFANVLVYRLPRGLVWWRGRSVCPNCHHTLGPWELIPVLSWLWQRRRCRHCSQLISWRYITGEITLALLYAWAAATFGWSWLLALALFVGLVFFVLFWVDLEHGILPDSITLPAIVVTAVAQLYLGLPWQTLAIGMAVGSGLFLFQYAVSGGRWVGGGDIRLGALLGALLGWPMVLVALMLAYCSGALVGIWLLLTKRAQVNSAVPFGPFLVAAGWVVWLIYPLFK